ncbi:MAG: 2-enoate reductase, partial [Deltaproteobacteria bacterium]
LKGKKTAGDRVVIVGGGLAGCEVAIWLADKGRQTIIVEMLPELMAGNNHVPGQVRMMTLNLLEKHSTTIITDNQVSVAGTH